jgi:hypothetical protein
MNRIGIMLSLAITSVAMFATPAFAAGTYPPPPTTPPPPLPPATPPALPFTGASISLGLIILVVLVVVGTALLLAGRRRKVT